MIHLSRGHKMRILKFFIVFLLIGLIPAHAEQRRVEIKQLTVNGVYINGWSLPKSNGADYVGSKSTITTDSIYQNGNNGYGTLATMINASGDVLESYQVSYDNINWWTPNVIQSNNAGTISSIATIDSNMLTNSWIQYNWTIAPYVRFIYTNKNTTGNSVITADALWQDIS